jgi:hypothetical protein
MNTKNVKEVSTMGNNQASPIFLLSDEQEVLLPSKNGQPVRVGALTVAEDYSLTGNQYTAITNVLQKVYETIWNALIDKEFFKNDYEFFLRQTIPALDLSALALGIIQATWDKVQAFGLCETCGQGNLYTIDTSLIRIKDNFQAKNVDLNQTKPIELTIKNRRIVFHMKLVSTADYLQSLIYLTRKQDESVFLTSIEDLIQKILLLDTQLQNLYRIFARAVKKIEVYDTGSNQLIATIERPDDIYLSDIQTFNQYDAFIQTLASLPLKYETQLIEKYNEAFKDETPVFELEDIKLPCKTEGCKGQAEILVDPLFFLVLKIFFNPGD